MSIAHLKLTHEQFAVLSPVLGDLCQIKLLLQEEADHISDMEGKTWEANLQPLMQAVAGAFSLEEAMMLSGVLTAMLGLEGQAPVKVAVIPVNRTKPTGEGLDPGEETTFVMRPRSAG